MRLTGGFVVVVLAGCFSGSRMGAADVRQDADLPCFSVAPAEMRAVPGLRLHAIIVSDVSAGPAATVWSMGVESMSSLGADTCVRYGAVPPGYSGTSAHPLQPNRVYEVFVNANAEGGRGSAQGYSVRFCQSTARGATRWLPLEPGEPTDVCARH